MSVEALCSVSGIDEDRKSTMDLKVADLRFNSVPIHDIHMYYIQIYYISVYSMDYILYIILNEHTHICYYYNYCTYYDYGMTTNIFVIATHPSGSHQAPPA